MNGYRIRPLVYFQILAQAWLIAAIGTIALAQPESRHCTRCDAVINEKAKVVVTDFAASREHLCCNLACAVALMAEKYPTSRAVAHDPFAGKETRVIRTGAKWVAWPKTAVFLYVETGSATPGSSPHNGANAATGKPDTPGARTPANGARPPAPAAALVCFAFPRQVEYVQYLATHPDVAGLKPRPLRLADLLAALKEQRQAADKPPAK